MPSDTEPPLTAVIPEIAADPGRFTPSNLTLGIDCFMRYFIQAGGLVVIVAVAGIFFFILFQIIPLFQGAKVEEVRSVQLPENNYQILGVDEWSEVPFVVQPDGKLTFVDLAGDRGTFELDPGYPAETQISAIKYNIRTQSLVCGTTDGKFSTIRIDYSPDFSGDKRIITPKLEATPFYEIGRPGIPIQAIAAGDAGDEKLIATVQQFGDQSELHAVLIKRKRSLLGMGEPEVAASYDLTPQLSGRPVELLVPAQADSILVTTAGGMVEYFFREDDKFELRQCFQPFEDLEDPSIASIDYLLGDVSLVLSSVSGENRVFSLYNKPGEYVRTFGETKKFPKLPSGAAFYAPSLRNKAFVTGTGDLASLRYSTTEEVRWEQKLPFKIEKVAIGGKYDRLLFLDRTSKLHVYNLSDPHPEASWRALFEKVWYEGYPEPKYEWQSTGGTDDFEPKFSLIPLIIGTLKGTLYAMIFAVPIALLAAIYTSQFLAPGQRAVIKPAMEIMASLPSVVLGFLAALWLAPLIETRVPSLLAIIVLLPLSAWAVGFIWSSLPMRLRNLVKPGWEWVAFLPVLFAVFYGGWRLGPILEHYVFVITDPATGARIADFRRWWPEVTGTPFQQRNSLVVGFMMGFAVIPIIFTITEDALSNVPTSLRSGSLALGASRWQTAMMIVLPTASAGIFSALMIGLGRAVGETMIVVMATGNTPIMDLNIFSGMRTLSANIAVELPEAPHGATLYRVLFLGAMALFLMTFVVNTLAEILRQHLREKYKTV